MINRDLQSLSILSADELIWLDALHLREIVSVRQFEQALTNKVFLLTDVRHQHRIFKRLNLQVRDRQHRQRELAVHKLASDRGLTPKVLADCDKYRLQEYLPGNSLAGVCVSDNSIVLLAAQLQIIHQLPPLHARPQCLASELLFLKKELKKQLNNPVDESKFQHFLQLAMQLDKSSTKDILCHGDLSFNNLLRTENGQIKILDWEYAVLACPAYDLAACSCINALTAVQQAQLIRHYYSVQKEHLALSLAQLQKECALYYSVFTYLNQLWAECFSEK